MINKDNFSVFVVDELDEPSEISAQVIEQEEKFIDDELVPIAIQMETLPCMCSNTLEIDDTETVLNGTDVIEKNASDVKPGDLILTPINRQLSFVPMQSEYEYSAIVHAKDNVYIRSIAIIRHCTKCGAINIAGDKDVITKILGMGYMSVLDHEQKTVDSEEGAEAVSTRCSCAGNCGGCCTCSDKTYPPTKFSDPDKPEEREMECEG